METLTEAMRGLRAAGYLVDFVAASDGCLRCSGCDREHDAESVAVDEIVRFEGVSDPDDEAILLALECASGHRGLFAAAFGPQIDVANGAVLRRLPRTRRRVAHG